MLLTKEQENQALENCRKEQRDLISKLQSGPRGGKSYWNIQSRLVELALIENKLTGGEWV